MKDVSKIKKVQLIITNIAMLIGIVLLIAAFNTGETDIARQNTITGYVRIYTCVIVPLSIGLNVYFNKKKKKISES